MLDSVLEFFSEALEPVFTFLFDTVFVRFHDICVSYGKSFIDTIFSYLYSINVSSLFDSDFFFFLIGIFVVVFLIRLAVSIIRG